jgi:hypothetical protein
MAFTRGESRRVAGSRPAHELPAGLYTKARLDTPPNAKSRPLATAAAPWLLAKGPTRRWTTCWTAGCRRRHCWSTGRCLARPGNRRSRPPPTRVRRRERHGGSSVESTLAPRRLKALSMSQIGPDSVRPGTRTRVRQASGPVAPGGNRPATRCRTRS